MTSWELSQVCQVGLTSIKMKKQKQQKNIWLSQETQEKHLKKSQHPFTIKTLRKLGIEENLFNWIKTIYEKP